MRRQRELTEERFRPSRLERLEIESAAGDINADRQGNLDLLSQELTRSDHGLVAPQLGDAVAADEEALRVSLWDLADACPERVRENVEWICSVNPDELVSDANAVLENRNDAK